MRNKKPAPFRKGVPTIVNHCEHDAGYTKKWKLGICRSCLKVVHTEDQKE